MKGTALVAIVALNRTGADRSRRLIQAPFGNSMVRRWFTIPSRGTCSHSVPPTGNRVWRNWLYVAGSTTYFRFLLHKIA